jgi:hypothetical protein
MKAVREHRSTKRFAETGRVEIRMLCRAGWHGVGELIDSSQGGMGVCTSDVLKRGTIIVLRMNEKTPATATRWHQEAGQFNLVTAKIRWCQELRSDSGASVFRIGVQRLLPCS